MKRTLRDYGVCPSTGKWLNPFGVKPEWVWKKVARLQQQYVVDTTEEALF